MGDKFVEPETDKSLAPVKNDLVASSREFQHELPTPESVTSYWRAKLRAGAERIGITIDVPDCDWTAEEIQAPIVDQEGSSLFSMMAYYPPELVGKQGLFRLGQIFPEILNAPERQDIPSWIPPAFREGTSISDTHSTVGWTKVVFTRTASILSSDIKKVQKPYIARGYRGLRLSTYTLATVASKDLTGHYLDEYIESNEENSDSSTLILGSYDDGDNEPRTADWYSNSDYEFVLVSDDTGNLRIGKSESRKQLDTPGYISVTPLTPRLTHTSLGFEVVKHARGQTLRNFSSHVRQLVPGLR